MTIFREKTSIPSSIGIGYLWISFHPEEKNVPLVTRKVKISSKEFIIREYQRLPMKKKLQNNIKTNLKEKVAFQKSTIRSINFMTFNSFTLEM